MEFRTVGNTLRVAGLAAIAFATLRGISADSDPLWLNLVTMAGMLGLVGFLWLALTGFFGYGSFCRSDWVGLIPFVLALAIREVLTLHSVEGIQIQFATRIQFTHGPVGAHSVLYPLLQLFLVRIVRDPQWFTMHLNGCLGALASLPLYLFVRQRTASRCAGFLTALFLATHPLVARFSPTDGSYSLLLATWFSGLALLSAPHLGARAILGGAGLLGITATLRLEGVLLLVASLLMLDVRTLIEAARRQQRAAVYALLLVGTLGALQSYFFLPATIGGTLIYLPEARGLTQVSDMFFWPILHNGAVFAALVGVGVVSGIATGERLGLFAFIAMLLVVAPVINSTHATGLHRLVPACALQALVAGMGAYAITAWTLSARRWYLLSAVPSLAALYVLAQNRGDLTRPYVFTEEYDLVRAHLAPRGRADGCTLLVFGTQDDEDVHNFDAVVPEMRVLDCRTRHCLAEVSSAGCFYYLRAAVSYFHDAGIPPTCIAVSEGKSHDPLACLNEPSATFEKAIDLQPVEVRTIDIHDTFPEWTRSYPPRAPVGLFRVHAK